MKTALALAAALAVGVNAGAADMPQPQPSVEQWPLPWRNARPQAPCVGPRGLVWFAAARGGFVGAFDPASGDFQRFDLAPGTAPDEVVVDSHGTIYFAGGSRTSLGRLGPAGEPMDDLTLPSGDARNPGGLTLAGSAHLYFTAGDGGFIGRVTLPSGEVALVGVPTGHGRPYGIAADTSGTIWSPELGANKLAKLDPDTLSLSEVVLPRDSSRPRRLAATSDGRVWYVDYAAGMLGFLHPASGLFKEYPLPGGGDGHPFGLAADRHDMLWIVESGSSSDRLLAFDPVTETFTEPVSLPSGGGTVRHLCYDAQADALWFATHGNAIGRVRLYPRSP